MAAPSYATSFDKFPALFADSMDDLRFAQEQSAFMKSLKEAYSSFAKTLQKLTQKYISTKLGTYPSSHLKELWNVIFDDINNTANSYQEISSSIDTAIYQKLEEIVEKRQATRKKIVTDANNAVENLKNAVSNLDKAKTAYFAKGKLVEEAQQLTIKAQTNPKTTPKDIIKFEDKEDKAKIGFNVSCDNYKHLLKETNNLRTETYEKLYPQIFSSFEVFKEEGLAHYFNIARSYSNIVTSLPSQINESSSRINLVLTKVNARTVINSFIEENKCPMGPITPIEFIQFNASLPMQASSAVSDAAEEYNAKRLSIQMSAKLPGDFEKLKAGNDNEDSDSSEKKEEKKKSGFSGLLKGLKKGKSANRLSMDVDVDARKSFDFGIKKPDLDVDLPKIPDVDLPDVDIKKPDIDIDIKAPKIPDVDLPDIDIKKPDFSFKKPDIDIPDKPKIGFSKIADIKTPDFDIDVKKPKIPDVDLPDFDIKKPDIDIDIKAPKIPDVDLPDIDIKKPDIDIKKKGFSFDDETIRVAKKAPTSNFDDETIRVTKKAPAVNLDDETIRVPKKAPAANFDDETIRVAKKKSPDVDVDVDKSSSDEEKEKKAPSNPANRPTKRPTKPAGRGGRGGKLGSVRAKKVANMDDETIRVTKNSPDLDDETIRVTKASPTNFDDETIRVAKKAPTSNFDDETIRVTKKAPAANFDDETIRVPKKGKAAASNFDDETIRVTKKAPASNFDDETIRVTKKAPAANFDDETIRVPKKGKAAASNFDDETIRVTKKAPASNFDDETIRVTKKAPVPVSNTDDTIRVPKTSAPLVVNRDDEMFKKSSPNNNEEEGEEKPVTRSNLTRPTKKATAASTTSAYGTKKPSEIAREKRLSRGNMQAIQKNPDA